MGGWSNDNRDNQRWLGKIMTDQTQSDDPEDTLVTKKFALLAAYPVGCIYISTVDTNPNSLFGGTWAKFGGGRVLVGQDTGQTEFDTIEETGGSKTHTLTTAELPAHSHPISLFNAGTTGGRVGAGSATPTTAGATGNTGSGDAHNNLQPYIVVIFWKRTA